MRISSRTPEGEPNHCPICRSEIVIEPSQPFGDAPCPSCGHLLWFIGVGEQYHWFDLESDELREQVLRLIRANPMKASSIIQERLQRDNSERLGNLDSLELVELVMELEDLSNE